MAETWRDEQDRLKHEIAHQSADRTYIDGGARLLELAQDAQNLFAEQESHEQRRLLNFILLKSTWANGNLEPVFRQPFDLIVGTTIAMRKIGSEKARAGI